MVEKVFPVAESDVEVTENEVEVTKGELEHVDSHVFIVQPGTAATTSGGFTRSVFEHALDKVSRPVKGKYADMLPSSQEVIKDKRREVGLEDRQP